jgi:hypothetical protein
MCFEFVNNDISFYPVNSFNYLTITKFRSLFKGTITLVNFLLITPLFIGGDYPKI